MKLIDGNGNDLKKKPELLDSQGRGLEINSINKPMTVQDLGRQLAAHMMVGAEKMPTHEMFQKNLDVAYYAALNLIAHRITNIALGHADPNCKISNWDEERNLNETSQVISDLGKVCQEWKELYFNGELKYGKPKP